MVRSKRRIGGVPYGVGAPLLAGLESDPDIQFERLPPSQLVEELRAGTMDAALVSSIEGFRRPGYRMFDGVSIASRGPARSVRVFRKREPIRTIGLDSGSATTVVLLHTLLAQGRLGAVADDPEFVTITPLVTPDDLPHDLVMLIGDCGLNATTTISEPIDLGEQWFAWTGLPFVYAVWLLREGVDPAPILPKLQAARDRAVAEAVDDGTGGAIYYEFGELERRGLRRFRDEAARLDLADGSLWPESVGL